MLMKKKIVRDKLGKGVWTEEQEDELRNLFMENQTNPTTEKGDQFRNNF